jgi:hypothetical protein
VTRPWTNFDTSMQTLELAIAVNRSNRGVDLRSKGRVGGSKQQFGSHGVLEQVARELGLGRWTRGRRVLVVVVEEEEDWQ